jgi:nucleotide-binding universal stress UspA family protein
MFTRIIVPLDGTPQANAALPLALTFAHATAAPITLLRVLPEAESEKEASAALQRIAHELAGSEVHVSPLIRHGDPAQEILDEVRSERADLIIMRTHGRSGLGRAVFGSVTERVLARSTVPVVLMRPGGHRVSQLRSLLVPVDGSPGGAVALGTALGLAQLTGAGLHLVQVVVPIPNYIYTEFAVSGGTYIDPSWDEDAKAAAEAYVDGITSRLHAGGVTAVGEVIVAPSIADALVRSAEVAQADVIVMSTDALTGAARALLGSVADAVVRAAQCPVLIVRRTPPKAPTVHTEKEAADLVTGVR